MSPMTNAPAPPSCTHCPIVCGCVLKLPPRFDPPYCCRSVFSVSSVLSPWTLYVQRTNPSRRAKRFGSVRRAGLHPGRLRTFCSILIHLNLNYLDEVLTPSHCLISA